MGIGKVKSTGFLYGMQYLSQIYFGFYYFISVLYEALNYVHYALQQRLCKHHMHWLCVNVMIISLIERRKELFPVTLNRSCPLDWKSLILVSEIKNTNMSSGEMIANHQFCKCLIWLRRPCWSWTVNSIIWCMKDILKENLQIKWIECTHLL